MISLEKVLQTLVAGIVVFFSAHLFLSRDPELQAVASSDGVVHIEGLARQAQTFSIASADVTVATPLLGTAYALSPANETYDVPVTITWDHAPEGALVYRWDDAWGFWVPLPQDTVAHIDDTLVITTDTLGTFALGSPLHVETPIFLDALDELLAKAPADAVGYRVALAVASESGVSVLLDDTFAQGGCGALLHNGEHISWSQTDRNAVVVANDVMTSTTFHFIAQWEGDGVGCAADSPLHAREKRATL